MISSLRYQLLIASISLGFFVGCTSNESTDRNSEASRLPAAVQESATSTLQASLTASGSNTDKTAIKAGIATSDNADFGGYWYQGKAEITSYRLSQARYGEMRQGEAVLIFVTEDFSKSKQVKLDYPGKNRSDAEGVLKMNFTKRFDTGIYPYSMMLSTFTPVDPALAGNSQSKKKEAPTALKLTTSSQEWCGHTFSQLNLREEGYNAQVRSYFESEGDEDVSLGNYLCEDELWTRVRLNPTALPTGKLKLIPSNFAARLLHFDLQAINAEAELEKHPELEGHMQYSISYPEMNRSISITFRQAFPHTITGWEETYKDGFGSGAKMLTTKAQLIEQRMLPYWNLNSNADAHLRTELGLEK